MYSSTLLNEHGDLTISWDDSTLEEVKELIQQKMDQGYTFFVVEKLFGVIPQKRKLVDPAHLQARGKVVMKDKDVQRLYQEGKVDLAAPQSMPDNLIDFNQLKLKGAATSAHQAATSHTVAVRPAVGG